MADDEIPSNAAVAAATALIASDGDPVKASALLAYFAGRGDEDCGLAVMVIARARKHFPPVATTGG